MESAAALEIWGRSIEKRRLAYTTYVGDGDSSSFKRLSDSDPYHGYHGNEIVRKEECVGHTQKRLKKHLRKPTTKTVSSKPITQTKVERIGHLYALVVVQNRGRTPQDIQRALYTLQEHLVEKHDSCPHSLDSWCHFQKALALRANDPSSAPARLRKPYLDASELDRLRYVFEKFASIDMCSALTLGLTQNSNESLHSVLWHNAPKTKRVGQKSLKVSASLAVSTFNEGSMIFAAVLADLGIQCSHKTLAHFAMMDRERIRCREKAVTATQKRRRRLLKSRSLASEKSREKRETHTAYKSGAFGSEITSDPQATQASANSDSDTVCEECKSRECPVGRKRKKDDWIACECCEQWFHTRCVEVDLKSLGDAPFICDTCDDKIESFS